MDKLGTMKECPKCGCGEFSIRYIEPDILSSFGTEDIIDRDEFMEVRCEGCRYIRKEYPLDTKDGIKVNK